MTAPRPTEGEDPSAQQARLKALEDRRQAIYRAAQRRALGGRVDRRAALAKAWEPLLSREGRTRGRGGAR